MVYNDAISNASKRFSRSMHKTSDYSNTNVDSNKSLYMGFMPMGDTRLYDSAISD